MLTEANNKHKVVIQADNTTVSTYIKIIGKSNNNGKSSEAHSEPSQKLKIESL